MWFYYASPILLLATCTCIFQDYVRAAMTCIKFYIGFTKRSTTIQDLHERRKYLQTAKQHFETSLESPQYRGRVFGRFSDDQSQASLPKNMKAQELQVECHTHYCSIYFVSVNYNCKVYHWLVIVYYNSLPFLSLSSPSFLFLPSPSLARCIFTQCVSN